MLVFVILPALLGHCYSTLQSLKGAQKEKYSINTLYDETVGVHMICHLGNQIRLPRVNLYLYTHTLQNTNKQ